MKLGKIPSISLVRVIWRTCVFYWPSHLLTALAVAVCTVVLAGALIVGDSVRGTLIKVADQRLGHVQYAWFAGDRLFRQALGREMMERFSANLTGRAIARSNVNCQGLTRDFGVTTILSLGGVAATQDGQRRTGGVRVVGVQSSFAQMSSAGFPAVTGGAVVVNRRLADVLSLRVDDEVVLRVERPDALREMALEASGRASVACRVTVSAIAGDGEFGRFGLENTQVPPLNAFVDLAFLQKLTGAGEQANLLLISGIDDLLMAESALRQAWDYPDGGLEWRTVRTGKVGEFRSRSIFLEESIARAAGVVSSQSVGVLTYLVNSIKAKGRTTPYSFVAGVEAPPGGGVIGSGEIVVTDWLADDLDVAAGDAIELRSYVMGSLRTLTETSAVFRVKAVVPIAEAADESLMPAIPGITDAGSCGDWDTGLPVDFAKVREKDEAYWDQWKGAPKAFIGLEDARRLWGSRWGGLTAIRYDGTEEERRIIREKLRALLVEAGAGPSLRAVRAEAEQAGSDALDFGQLFMGLSFFLVISAVMLMGLLFGLAGERRMEQTGVLMALGFDSRVLKRWAMGEGIVTAMAGGALGCLGGEGYARGLIWLLESRWVGEVPLGLDIHVSWVSLAVAAGTALVLAIVISGSVARRLMRMQTRNLMDALIDERVKRHRRWGLKIWSGTGVLAIVMAGGLAWMARGAGHESRVAMFFGLGFCLLVAGAAVLRRLIDSWGKKRDAMPAGILELARRNAGRNAKRSFLVSGLTACAVFLLVAVALFEPAKDDSGGRGTGTGGYELMVQTTVPIAADLNLERERQRRGLTGDAFKQVAFTGLRVVRGDDAGCGNLNRAQKPRLVGVDPVDLSRQKSFRFINTLPVAGSESPWMLLEKDLGHDVVPAVADEATLMWGLEKQVGDEVLYRDENGKTFRLRFVGMLANSVLQGHVIVPDGVLSRRFPTEAGVRLLLVDVPTDAQKEVAGVLSRQLGDDGAEVVACVDRLRQLNAVTALYIRIFQILGGLGLLLGVLGVAVVVARNGIERRGELALLRATGYSRRESVMLLAGEQVWLIGLGIAVGCLAAVAAVWPVMTSGQAGSWSAWVVPVIGIFAVKIGGVAASVLTAMRVTRGEPWEALRQE